MFLSVGFQLLVWLDLRAQPFFIPRNPYSTGSIYFAYETSAMFVMNAFQTLTIALAYNLNRPFKKSVVTNRMLY